MGYPLPWYESLPEELPAGVRRMRERVMGYTDDGILVIDRELMLIAPAVPFKLVYDVERGIFVAHPLE